jgi:hypothetical protein
MFMGVMWRMVFLRLEGKTGKRKKERKGEYRISNIEPRNRRSERQRQKGEWRV